MAQSEKQLENLKPAFTPSQARELGSKGGKASAKKRAEQKTMREQLELILALPVKNEKIKEQIRDLGITDKDINNSMAGAVVAFREMLKGNLKAIEFVRDTIGQKPVDKLEVKEVDTDWFIEE